MSNKGSDSGFIEVENVLHALARSFSKAQKDLDQRSLDLAREFLELDTVGFSLEGDAMVRIPGNASGETGPVLPLHSMVSFRRYRISELLLEFSVIGEDGRPDTPGGQTRFRVVPSGSQSEHVRPACIKVKGKGAVFAEFQVAGETKISVVLRS